MEIRLRPVPDLILTTAAVTVNPDGTWTYVPDTNFERTDTFTVVIDDGNGGISSVLVDVTVVAVNDAPDVVSNVVEISTLEPIELGIPLPTDVDDAAVALLSTIQQLPDPLIGTLTYLPGGVTMATPVPLALVWS